MTSSFDPNRPDSAWTPPVASGGPSLPATEERTWAMLAHLSAPIATVDSAGWLNFAGPLVVWLLYNDRSWFVRNAAAGAFNFMITTWVMSIIGWVMVFTIILLPIGVLLIAAASLLAIILGVVGALKTWQGESYTYPWQVRIIT